MIFKTEDARNFWCPMVRHIDDEPGQQPCNRYCENEDGGATGGSTWNRCVGERCAMWVRVSVGGADIREHGECGLVTRLPR